MLKSVSVLGKKGEPSLVLLPWECFWDRLPGERGAPWTAPATTGLPPDAHTPAQEALEASGLRDAPLAFAPWSALRPLKADTGSGGHHLQAQPAASLPPRQPVRPRWVPAPCTVVLRRHHRVTRPHAVCLSLPGAQARPCQADRAAASASATQQPQSARPKAGQPAVGGGGAGATAAPETSLGRDPAHLGSVHRWDLAGQWRVGGSQGLGQAGVGVGGLTCAQIHASPSDAARSLPWAPSLLTPRGGPGAAYALAALLPASGRGRTRGASCRVPSSAASTHTRPRVACSPRGKSPRLRVKTPPPKNTPRHRHTGVSSKADGRPDSAQEHLKGNGGCSPQCRCGGQGAPGAGGAAGLEAVRSRCWQPRHGPMALHGCQTLPVTSGRWVSQPQPRGPASASLRPAPRPAPHQAKAATPAHWEGEEGLS